MTQSTANSRIAAGSISLVERGLVPDPLVRAGIRRLCAARLVAIGADDAEISALRTTGFVDAMATAPVAPLPELANQQHYEVPAEFFAQVLGPQRKYSCAWWPDDVGTLAEAEDLALLATMERAELSNGQQVLELGCGWGSLTLAMARRYPRSRIVGVSNSNSQRTSILERAAAEGFTNIEVITADANTFTHEGGFDRVVSGGNVRTPAQLASHVWPGAQLAQTRWPLLHACVRPPIHALCLRRRRRHRLDEPSLLLWRHDAQRRAALAFPAGAAASASLALGRSSLREDSQCLAGKPGRAPRRRAAGIGSHLRRSGGMHGEPRAPQRGCCEAPGLGAATGIAEHAIQIAAAGPQQL